ncbi:P22 phage major capsid protein family protein [Halomonas sp.]|uniref:P22 phage major capsid protein family protein n=1 Tax=Halomonas sp. TaxID=1486246 RepID=UPI0035667CB3
MANVLNDLAADIYTAADIVGRELTGGASSVMINANGSERVALDDVVRSHFTRQATSAGISPSMTIPEGTDQTVDSKTLSISKAKGVQIPWTGEDMRHVNNGAGFETIYGDQIRQAMRTLTNEIEVDIMTEAYQNASRAVGTAGTTPFSGDFDLVAEARQILVDNGAPMDGMSTMVLNTLAGTNLRNLARLQRANEAGGTDVLRQGVLLDLQGIAMKESAGVQAHTKGTTTGVTVTALTAVGSTSIGVTTSAGGSVGLTAGDILAIAGDSNKYVVAEDVTVGASTTGVITIADPGLREAASSSSAVTVGNSYTGNVAWHRNSLELAMRAPAVPQGGDTADDAMIIQDPNSGLVYEIRTYKGYRKAMFEVAATWGTKAWKSDFIAAILG